MPKRRAKTAFNVLHPGATIDVTLEARFGIGVGNAHRFAADGDAARNTLSERQADFADAFIQRDLRPQAHSVTSSSAAA
jgi:hypothetical protein